MKKQDLITQFNLPNYLKGKTASQAARAIENKFEGRNDKISLQTKQDLLERVKAAQDYIKQQYGLMQNQNQKFMGGPASDMNASKAAAGKLAGGGMDAVAGVGALAGGVMDMTARLTEKQKYDIAGGEDPMDTEINTGGNILGGAMEGASAGAALGPLGAAGGAVVGAGVGLAQSIMGKNAQNDADKKFVSRKSNMANNKYELGGNTGCGGPGQPPCEDLGMEDLKKMNKDTNAPLTFPEDESGMKAMNTLFQNPPEVDRANVNLGKYKDVNYFGFDKTDPSGRTLVRGPGQKYNRDAVKRQFKNVQNLNPGIDLKYNEYKLGGLTLDTSRLPLQNQFDNGGIPQTRIGIQPFETRGVNPISAGVYSTPTRGIQIDEFDPVSVLTRSPQYQEENKNVLGDFLKSDKFKNILGDTARLAPAISNAAQLLNSEQASPTRLDRLDARYKPQYADEASAERRIDNITGNLSESIANASAGSNAALRGNLLGAYLRKGQLTSEEAMKTSQANRTENARAQQFNIGVDQTNLRQSNLEQDMAARDEGAYTSDKSKMLSALTTDVGQVGLEKTREMYAKKMGLLYDSKGNYIGRVDKQTGRFISAAEDQTQNTQ